MAFIISQFLRVKNSGWLSCIHYSSDSCQGAIRRCWVGLRNHLKVGLGKELLWAAVVIGRIQFSAACWPVGLDSLLAVNLRCPQSSPSVPFLPWGISQHVICFIKPSKWDTASKIEVTICCNLREVSSLSVQAFCSLESRGGDYKGPWILVGRDHWGTILKAPYHRYHVAFSWHILVSESFSICPLRRPRHCAIPEATSTASIQILVSKCYSLIKEARTPWRNGWF